MHRYKLDICLNDVIVIGFVIIDKTFHNLDKQISISGNI